jgi:ribonuclease III
VSRPAPRDLGRTFDQINGDQLNQALGISISPALLTMAMTHRSYSYEYGGLPTNERLEFLGDSVLGLVVTEELYDRFPDVSEGRLAKLRAAVVNMRALADAARMLDLGSHILLGKGEEVTGGRDKASILADTLEALIGAIHVEHGVEVSSAVVRRLMQATIEHAADLGAGLDWKTSLQELTTSKGMGTPDYEVDESGPDHAKAFVARAMVRGQVYGSGSGRSKKEAEQQAAEAAYIALSVNA